MATQDLATILSALAQNFRNDIVKTYNRRSSLFRLLPVVKGEGKNVAWVWESDGAMAETFTDGAAVSVYGSDAESTATLSWAKYRSNFQVTDLARAASASSRTPAGLLNLWARNMMGAVSKTASVLNQAAFNGAGGNALVGLDTALDDANIYATVDRSSATSFRSTVIDPGSLTAPTLTLIRDDLRQVFEKSGETPDIAICSPAVFNKIGGLYDANRRFVSDITTAKGQIRLDGSLGGIEIDGCVFFRDKDATANRIYYINSAAARFEYLEQDDMNRSATAQLNDGNGGMPLGLKVKMLATDGAAEKATLQTFLQLVVEAPHMCGVRKNVAV